MQIDTNIRFDVVSRDALLAMLRQKGKMPTLYSRPYGDNDENEQRRYWVEFLRWAQAALKQQETRR